LVTILEKLSMSPVFPVEPTRIAEEKYALKALGCDFDQAVTRVAHVLGMTPKAVTAFGKSPSTVKTRELLCFWAHGKLGRRTIEIAGKLRISQPAVSR
jgi:hypothetical protein